MILAPHSNAPIQLICNLQSAKQLDLGLLRAFLTANYSIYPKYFDHSPPNLIYCNLLQWYIYVNLRSRNSMNTEEGFAPKTYAIWTKFVNPVG